MKKSPAFKEGQAAAAAQLAVEKDTGLKQPLVINPYVGEVEEYDDWNNGYWEPCEEWDPE